MDELAEKMIAILERYEDQAGNIIDDYAIHKRFFESFEIIQALEVIRYLKEKTK